MSLLILIKGILLLIYGILKSTFCICDLLPITILEFSFLIHDTSTAGLLLIIIFLAFSTYTIFHGLSTLRMTLPKIIKFFDYRYRSVITYSIFGLILIPLFSLISFTNLINKNEKHQDSYIIIGFGGGFIFLASAMIVLTIKRNVFDILSIILIIIIIIFIGIFVIIVKFATKSTNNNSSIVYNTISAGIVPFTAL